MSDDDREELGIPTDATVWTATAPLPEGWTLNEIGVRLENPPPRPWEWPYAILRNSKIAMVVQVWRRTLIRPGFEYSVIWHPKHGRYYRVESQDPDFAGLVRDAQKVIRRERRGRQRHRPTPAQYIGDWERINRAGGRPPSRDRMAEQYGVERDTIRKWLQRPEWVAAVPDKYRTE